MSTTGLEVFDRTLQATHIWLDEIMGEVGPDRQHAYHVLRAVLHALRDRLPTPTAVHLGAQLPLLVRGIYYDSWSLGGEQAHGRKLDDFLAQVEAGLAATRPTNAEDAARAVFGVISRHVSAGETEKVMHVLPKEIRSLWAPR
jgi:uncharacterized protein (DUF2267 family)